MHRDLKPDNIGFGADGRFARPLFLVRPPPSHTLKPPRPTCRRSRLVLFDFGLAKLWRIGPDELDDAVRPLTGQVGSARYMAPEVALSRPYGTSAEVYSFGVILWQARTRAHPWRCPTSRHAPPSSTPPPRPAHNSSSMSRCSAVGLT